MWFLVLNIVISDEYYLNSFNRIGRYKIWFRNTNLKTAVMVEYSSPNTNKPLHLGHVRNNLLGYSVAEIITSKKKYIKPNHDRGFIFANQCCMAEI
jgi:arginyl-tRNA synthetase